MLVSQGLSALRIFVGQPTGKLKAARLPFPASLCLSRLYCYIVCVPASPVDPPLSHAVSGMIFYLLVSTCVPAFSRLSVCQTLALFAVSVSLRALVVPLDSRLSTLARSETAVLSRARTATGIRIERWTSRCGDRLALALPCLSGDRVYRLTGFVSCSPSAPCCLYVDRLRRSR